MIDDLIAIVVWYDEAESKIMMSSNTYYSSEFSTGSGNLLGRTKYLLEKLGTVAGDLLVHSLEACLQISR